VAKRITPQSRAFISAYRSLLANRDLSEVEKRSLVELRETYRTGVATTFLQVSDLLEMRRKDISRLEGKQQDLTRMIRRTVRALRDTERAVSDVSEFCSGELAKTIERLVRS
jgi:phage-related minor tail protein